jgi:hypothetical protein
MKKIRDDMQSEINILGKIFFVVISNKCDSLDVGDMNDPLQQVLDSISEQNMNQLMDSKYK